MTDNGFKYWPVLSFSPLDNRQQRSDSPEVSHRSWGNWWHDALKSFSTPAEFVGQINGRGEIVPERIDPFFQDEPELPEEATLNANMRKALEQSICLVVVCSPRSARSRQVNEAVRYFKQLGHGKHILPVVVAGEPNAGDGSKSGWSLADECFVPALRHPVSADGTLDTTRRAGKFIFVDARHGVEQREILANDHRAAEADLEMAKIQLIALLLSVGFNGLWRREQKRHFFDFAEAQHQAREALNQVTEVRRQLQEAQRQTREARNQALETQNLPRDVHGQIQEAQKQAREAEKQLQEFQNNVRDMQTQLEEARNRALAAESKVLEARHQARETQHESQLEEARNEALEIQDKLLAAQDQIRAAQNQFQEIQPQGWNARRLTQVFAILAVLALLAAGIAVSLAWRQRKVTSQALAKAAAEAAGKFDPVPGGLEPVRQVLENIGGAELADNRRRSLDQLAAGIPRAEIPEALQASAVIVDDSQRSHFQKWLLVRQGWVNPVAAMTYASAIEGNIVNDEGLIDSSSYFQLAVLDNWMKTDLPGAFNWVCHLPDANARQRALEKIIIWVQSQPDSKSQNQSLADCIEELAKTDVYRALTLIESLPEGVWRNRVISFIGDQIDPFATWNWIINSNLLPEIMPPRKTPSPWTKFLRDANFGSPIIFRLKPEFY